MTQTYSVDVLVDGSDNTKAQLRVQGASGQTEALQTWEADATTLPSTNALARVTKDGNFQIGNVDATADALVEIRRYDNTSGDNSSRPQRGIHVFGRIFTALSDAVTWAVHELELAGSAGVNTLQTAFRAKVTNNNTGTLTGAEFRAGDFQAINQAGTSTSTGKYAGLRATASNVASKQANKLVGVEAAISNDTSGTVTEAVGFEVVTPVNNGTITTIYGLKIPNLGASHYAVQTGTGKVDFGDTVSVASLKLATGAGVNKVLTSDASGNATWQLPAIPSLVDGRLTLTSGTPVTTADITAATTLYFTPLNGNRLALYNGSAWVQYTFTERSLSLSSLSANTNYDIFLYDNSGTLTLEAVAWSSGTARTTSLVLQDGVYLKSGALTRRYLGTIRTVAAGQTEDSKARRFVWNLVNPALRRLRVIESANDWNYSSTAWRSVNNNSANKVEMVLGLDNTFVQAEALLSVISWNSTAGATGIGVDSTSVNDAQVHNEAVNTLSTAIRIPALAKYHGYPGLGYHYLQWLEYAQSGIVAFEGDAGNPTTIQSGMMGELWA